MRVISKVYDVLTCYGLDADDSDLTGGELIHSHEHTLAC